MAPSNTCHSVFVVELVAAWLIIECTPYVLATTLLSLLAILVVWPLFSALHSRSAGDSSVLIRVFTFVSLNRLVLHQRHKHSFSFKRQRPIMQQERKLLHCTQFLWGLKPYTANFITSTSTIGDADTSYFHLFCSHICRDESKSRNITLLQIKRPLPEQKGAWDDKMSRQYCTHIFTCDSGWLVPGHYWTCH